MKAMHVFSIAILVVAVAGTASTQRRMGGGNYNVSTETTLMGTIDSVTTLASERPGGGGQHLMLKTASGPIEVHVGPAWYVSSKHVTLSKDDQLTVVGSKVTMGGRDVVLAREIRKGNQRLSLRDARGIPLWSRGGGTQ
jgi:hypothetical protein